MITLATRLISSSWPLIFPGVVLQPLPSASTPSHTFRSCIPCRNNLHNKTTVSSVTSAFKANNECKYKNMTWNMKKIPSVFRHVMPICLQHCLQLFLCVFSLIFVFCVCTFSLLFPYGRLLVLNFSLVVPAICNFLLHICICFPSK